MSHPPALRPPAAAALDPGLGPDPIRGYLAPRRADVADARRGHPAHDLSGWARSRGHTPLGTRFPSGYYAAVPADPRQRFNLARGTARGRDVVVWHWRHRAVATGDGSVAGFPGGVEHDVRSAWSRWWWLPFGLGGSGPTAYVGVPVTGAAALVGEAATLPDLEVHRPADLGPDRHRAGIGHGLSVRSRHGLAEVREVLAAAGPLGLDRVLAVGGRQRSFLMRLRWGTLVLRLDGYADEAGLDEAVDLAGLAASSVAAACARRHRPVEHTRPLPPPPGAWDLPRRMREGLELVARGWGLEPEDPDAWHLSFPRLPVPGRARAVLRGRVGDHDGTARVVVCTEADPHAVNVGQTALVLDAGCRGDTDRAGTEVVDDVDPEARVRWAVADGLLAVWVLRQGAGEVGDLALLSRVAARVLRGPSGEGA